MFESFPNQERQYTIEEERVTETLRKEGKDSKEAIEILIAWREQEERKREDEGVKKDPRQAMLFSVELEIKQATILANAGLINEALEALDEFALEIPNSAVTYSEEPLRKIRAMQKALEEILENKEHLRQE